MHLYRYRTRLRAQGTVRFPAFPGPALRGALATSGTCTRRSSARTPPYLPLLRAARLLHAGKHTAFGFGAIELDERPKAASR